MKKIGISGRIGHGKDAAGDMLSYILNGGYSFMEYANNRTVLNQRATVLKFADGLKKRTAEYFDISVEKLEDQSFKNSIIPGTDMTYRKFLQEWGVACRGVLKDFWVRLAMKKLETYRLAGFQYGIFTDVRFKNEWDAMDLNIRIIRSEMLEKRWWVKVLRFIKLAPMLSLQEHISEISLDKETPDIIIYNDGDLRDLFYDLANIVRNEKLSKN